ncbi:MAG: VOC family protein [Nakamurella sp.]
MIPSPSTRPQIRFELTVLDTPDPKSSATFYAELLGWEMVRIEDDWVTVRGTSGPGLAFQLAPDFVAPTWPDPLVPQQSHLDFDVPDLDAAEAFALQLGACAVGERVPDDSFRVYLDPAGHPFCLCRP